MSDVASLTIAEEIRARAGLSSLTIPEFCKKKRISRAHYYNLRAIGRGPVESRMGGVVTITPEAEAAWDRDIAKNPIVGGVRKLAEQARSLESA